MNPLRSSNLIRIVGAILMAFAFSLSSENANAQQTCTDLFAGVTRLSANEVLTNLDHAAQGRLLQGRTLEDVRAEMGLLRKWKLARLKKQLDLSRLKVTDGDYSDVISSLHLIFIEPRLQPLDIFKFLKSDDHNRRFEAWVDRQILDHGLRGLIDDPHVGDPIYKTIIGRSLARVSAKLSKLPKLPFRLPRLSNAYHDQTIAPDLLVRVLKNGVESERPALEKLYGQQQPRDLMRALRPYISLVGFVAMSYGMDVANTKIQEHQARKNTAELEVQMQSTEQGLDELIAALREQKRLEAETHHKPRKSPTL